MNIQLVDTASHYEPLDTVSASCQNRSDDPGKPIQFGRFLVAPRTRRLFADGHQVEIGSRAFDLLIALLRSRGTIVSKSDLMAHAWPSTAVDESNLRFQMGTVRKALGKDRSFIKTIPGRGYMLAIDPPVAMPEDAALPWVARSKRFHRPVGVGSVPHEIAEDETATALSSGEPEMCFRSENAPAESLASILEPVREACSRLLNRSGLDILIQLTKANSPVSIILIGHCADAPVSIRAMFAELGMDREGEAETAHGRDAVVDLSQGYSRQGSACK